MTLLTTLIPAYKPDYLGEVFIGLRRQTLRDFRVILSDDSPGGVITDMIRDGRFGPLAGELNLLVVPGPGNARRNHEQLLDRWAGQTPLVHFHLDDDVIFPDFYRAHAAAHASTATKRGLGASISQRWLSQGNSLPAWDLPLPAFINDSPLRAVPVNSAQLFSSTVPMCENWLGELSNIVFSAEGARHYPRPPADGLSYYGLLDIGALLEAGSQLPLVFLRDHLGVFRQHAQQTTHQVHHHGGRISFLVWAATALHAWAQQRITAQQAAAAIGITVKRCLATYGETDEVVNQFYALVQREGASLAGLHQAFTAYWLQLLASHPATRAATVATAAAPQPAAEPLAV
jgi:hypothetical protein